MSKTKNRSIRMVSNEQLRNQYVANLLLERKLWLQQLLDPRRDIEAECGHPAELTIADYLRLYRRGDVAARVVSVWPEESWSERPFIYETEDPEDTPFEEAWKMLDRQHSIIPTLFRADVMSGIGRYGVILLGIDDGKTLDQPVAGVPISSNPTDAAQPDAESPKTEKPARRLLYLRVLDESAVSVGTWNKDTKNPRFGMPDTYTVTFDEGTSASVHWTRVIHIADNRISSEFHGCPRIERVVNRVLDLAKIAGGSGEMFWKGGFPGISLETLPEVLAHGTVTIDTESTKKQIDAYMNGLQRYIATIGMKANSLTAQLADPTPFAETHLKLIAIALSIPWRVFVGSESAQLASEQDARTWNRRLSRRRNDYVTPYIIRPFTQRLIDCKVLPRPKELLVDWPDLNTPSEKDKATVAEGLTKAMMDYIASGSDTLMPPFHFLTLVMGLSDYEARSVIEAAKKGQKDVDLDAAREGAEGDEEDDAQPAGRRNGTAASAATE